MTSPTYKAIPTEYAGVVFRSKSEAILALAFDLADFVWQYEPWWLGVNEGSYIWRPDFFVVSKHRWVDTDGRRVISSAIVEYKPCEVTDTCKQGLHRRFGDLGQRVDGHDELLITGNAYSKKVVVLRRDPGGWVESYHDPFTTLLQSLEEASRHRFDLKPEAG